MVGGLALNSSETRDQREHDSGDGEHADGGATPSATLLAVDLLLGDVQNGCGYVDDRLTQDGRRRLVVGTMRSP